MTADPPCRPSGLVRSLTAAIDWYQIRPQEDYVPRGEPIAGPYHYDERWRSFIVAPTYEGLEYLDGTICLTVEHERSGLEVIQAIRYLADAVQTDSRWPLARLGDPSGTVYLAPNDWCSREMASILLLHAADHIERHELPRNWTTIVLLDPDNRLWQALDRGLDTYSPDEQAELEALRRRNGV
jgi:hypothetical protein